MGSIFDNLDQAQVFENSAFFQKGKYLVEILACKFIQGYKGDSFVIETKVVQVNSDHPEAPQPGSIAAQVWNATGDKREIARSTWLGFMCAVFDKKKDDLPGEKWKELSAKVIDENALKGKQMALDVFIKKVQSTGNDFTHHKWFLPTAERLVEFGLSAAE